MSGSVKRLTISVLTRSDGRNLNDFSGRPTGVIFAVENYRKIVNGIFAVPLTIQPGSESDGLIPCVPLRRSATNRDSPPQRKEFYP
ncbi:MAG: hypothetical protein LBI05_10945 [Planctomycetaceae bacterium]|nr:hypothetical protein [Planctomycetaceae bacterium]